MSTDEIAARVEPLIPGPGRHADAPVCDDHGTGQMLFVGAVEKAEASPRSFEEDGISTLFQFDAGLGAVMSAPAPREWRMPVATAVRESWNSPLPGLSGDTP